MQKYLMKKLLYLITLYILCKSVEVKAEQNDVICKSATIRSISDFNRLQKCTVVIGYVRIIETNFSPSNLKEVQPSNIEEITSYLLVYHVEGLDSLERLFPKLMVIRGVELLYDEYALIVLENRNLQNIGLVSLLRVLKGSIRIENNPLLCFVNTINWARILGNHTKQYYYDVKNNKPSNECPLCYTYQEEMEVKEVNRHKTCWSHNKLQKTIQDHVGNENCNGNSNCLNSCSDRKCTRCTNYVSDEGCVNMCSPPKYKLAFKRQCVANCTQLKLVQLGVECVEKCPKHHDEVTINGAINCILNCKGNFVIHNVKDLESLDGCSKIDGSLTIEIHETDKHIVENLENAFRNLYEITGYLRILDSPQIVSLHFFNSLHTIGGSELLENRYSLYVINNRYLQELFIRNVIIVRGCVYFHLNPLLCYEKINALQNSFKDCMEITVMDASRHSNGERIVCGKHLHEANATVKDVNSDSAVIEVDAVDSNDLLILIGYVHFYKEAPFKNVTKFDGRHGCGRDSWFTDIVLKIHRRHVLRNLKPGTQYAFFVQSLTYTDYHYTSDYVSEIQYFKTLPSKPEKVARLYYHALSLKEIEIHWWPPRITNGDLEKYILQYEETNTAIPFEINEQNTTEVCQCPKLHTESYVPTPHVDSYYNREFVYYIDSILNFIYVKRTPKPANDTTETTTAATDNTDNTDTTTTTTTTTTIAAASDADFAGDTTTAIPSPKDIFEARMRAFFIRQEQIAFEKQDADKENYVIPHSYPICSQINPSIQYQMENKCVPQERFEGAIEIPSNRHVYMLKNLEPEKTYRISLRACVRGLGNGCGAAKVIFAQTVSKRMETMIKNLTFNKFAMLKK